MKLLYAVLLVFLVSVHGTKPTTEEPEETGEGSVTKVQCSAFAALKIRFVGTGRCKGVAGADCRAIATSQDDFKEAYNTWWSEDGGCEHVKLEEAAYAIANASAAVYAKTIAKVKCKGAGGYACGWAISEGSAYATAMARAIAQAAVDASSLDSDAFCIADVGAISGTIAEAAASSQAEACVTGTGSEEDFQEGFIETVAQALADALVKATASTCDEGGATAAQSACYGEAGGDTKGEVKKKATEKAKVKGKKTSAEQCPPEMDHCCKKSYRRVSCTCDSGSCEGRWYRRRDFTDRFTRTWSKPGAAKVVCLCKLPYT